MMPVNVHRKSVIVFDSNPDALRWRTGRVGQCVSPELIAATTSSIGAALAAEAAPDGAVVLVDLLATDRLALDRPGERLIRRLVRDPRTAHVRPVAWSAHRAPDVVESVRRSGAIGFVEAGVDDRQELEQLGAALAGREVWPAHTVEVVDEHARWFEAEFGMPWDPWIEAGLTRLVSGRDRKALALELIELGAADSMTHAASRMRRLARLVAGEHRNSPAAVAAAAETVLVQIAAHRPLADRPSPSLSLERSARLVQAAPSLVRAAGLTARGAGDLVELDRQIHAWRESRPAKRGAPSADEVREERRWAAGRVALQHDAELHNIDEIIDGILWRLDEMLAALDDARQDELYHPEARAGAALLLIEEGTCPPFEEVAVSEGTARWHGRTARELALAKDAEVEDLRRLIDRVDALAALP